MLRGKALVAMHYGVFGALSLLAAGFAIAGIYMSIAVELGAIAALFIMAASCLALAAIAFGIGRRVASQQARRRPHLKRTEPDLVQFHRPPSAAALIAASFMNGLARGLARRF